MSPGATTGRTPAREALSAATDALRAAGIDDPRVDAEALFAGITGRPAAELIAGLEAGLSPAESRACSQAIRRRLRREPVAYILGRRGFRHIEVEVDGRVLIPRPETEMLVELALELRPGSVLEIGTGSGAVALAIADEVPGCDLTATDTSPAALEVARSNARRLGLTERVRFLKGAWPEPGRFDLIVANLPYVPAGQPVAPEISDWEPAEALFPGETGLESFESVLGGLADAGVEAPVIGLEIGHDQAGPVTSMLSAAGFEGTECCRDLAGLDRLVVGVATRSASED